MTNYDDNNFESRDALWMEIERCMYVCDIMKGEVEVNPDAVSMHEYNRYSKRVGELFDLLNNWKED